MPIFIDNNDDEKRKERLMSTFNIVAVNISLFEHTKCLSGGGQSIDALRVVNDYIRPTLDRLSIFNLLF